MNCCFNMASNLISIKGKHKVCWKPLRVSAYGDGVLGFSEKTKRLLVVSSILPLELRIRILNLIVLMCLFDTQGYTVFITSNCNY